LAKNIVDAPRKYRKIVEKGLRRAGHPKQDLATLAPARFLFLSVKSSSEIE
jgi:hypothetical protein